MFRFLLCCCASRRNVTASERSGSGCLTEWRLDLREKEGGARQRKESRSLGQRVSEAFGDITVTKPQRTHTQLSPEQLTPHLFLLSLSHSLTGVTFLSTRNASYIYLLSSSFPAFLNSDTSACVRVPSYGSKTQAVVFVFV